MIFAVTKGRMTSSATTEVRSAIEASTSDSEFAVPSPRAEAAKELAAKILDSTATTRFATFSSDLIGKLSAVFTTVNRLKLHSSKRKKFWKDFHSLCETELPELWTKLLLDVGIVQEDTSLLTQHVNLQLFERMLLEYSRTPEADVVVPLLTADEANALRYAAGYVPFALGKKLKGRPEISNFLQSLGIEGEESSYLVYTKTWVNQINRGGLFKVNDEVFSFFVEVEMRLRRHLPHLFKVNPTIDKKEIIDDLVTSDDIICYWAVVTCDLDDEDLSVELLQHVIELWVTIRGFSAAGAWLEHYKQNIQRGMKGECGLRKGLKRKRKEKEGKDHED